MSPRRGKIFTLKGKAVPALKAGHCRPYKAKKQVLKAEVYRHPQRRVNLVATAFGVCSFGVVGQAVLLPLPAFGGAARWLHVAFA